MTDPQSEVITSYRASYQELVGFVPPRVASRFDALEGSNPELLVAQEELRRLVMYPDALDQHTVQLIVFAVLMSKLSDAAVTHGLAARRAGATWDELSAAANLAYLFSGVSVANRLPAVLEEIARKEQP